MQKTGFRLLASWVLVLQAGVGMAWSWGELGHRAVARVAEPLLTPGAKAEVQRLLGAGEDLASISVWADEIRGGRSESKPWHYITLQVRGPQIRPEAADTPNVLTALTRFTAILARPRGTAALDREKAEALRWVVHFMADAHQPLHAGEDHDKGGNQTKVRLGRRKLGWHQVWDHGYLDKLGLNEDALVARLQDSVQAWHKGKMSSSRRDALYSADFSAIVAESHALAVKAYAREGRPILGRGRAVTLEAEDVAWGQDVVLGQLAKAGMRLAFVLNRAFEPK